MLNIPEAEYNDAGDGYARFHARDKVFVDCSGKKPHFIDPSTGERVDADSLFGMEEPATSWRCKGMRGQAAWSDGWRPILAQLSACDRRNTARPPRGVRRYSAPV